VKARGWAIQYKFPLPYDIIVTNDVGEHVIVNVQSIEVPFDTEASALGAADDGLPRVIAKNQVVEGEVITDDSDQQFRDRAVEAVPPSVVPKVLPWHAAG
jgi:hypothetical protein